MSFLRAYVKFSTRLTLLGAGFKKHALANGPFDVDSPRIVAVESTGESDVLGSVVGGDISPRGTGIATRIEAS